MKHFSKMYKPVWDYTYSLCKHIIFISPNTMCAIFIKEYLRIKDKKKNIFFTSIVKLLN